MPHRTIGGALAAALLLLLCSPVLAALSGTFTVSPASGNAPLSATLSWNVTGFSAATTCVASGSWTGSKATSGSLGVTNLLSNASYTLTCTTPAIPGTPGTPLIPWTAHLSWVPPTQNTDNSVLTDLAGFRVLYGDSATALSQIVNVPGAGVTSYDIDFTANGAKFFAVRAYTSGASESANSNVASKTGTVTPATPGIPGVPADVWTRVVAVAVTPQPAPPLLTVAANAPAFRPNIGNVNKISAMQVGKMRVAANCDALQGFIAANTTYNLVLKQYVVTASGNPLPTNVLQTFARCQKVG